MKTISNFPIAIAGVAAMLVLTACGSKEGGAQPGAGTAPPPMEVDVVTVAKSSVLLTQDLPGRLEAYRTAQVRARVEGIVEKRQFVEGSDVNAGATLFQIDARNYRTAYDSAKTDMDVARQTVERYKPLLAAKAVSQQDFDLAEAKLKQAEAALSKAQLDIENTRVPAPIAGRIGRAQVTEGALVGHGEATLLATIEQVNPIYANFTQPGADLMRLQEEFESGKLKRAKAAQVELILEDGSIYPHPGKLLFSNLAVDPSTGSVSLRAEFPNPKKLLLPGMFASIRLAEGSSDDSIRIPQRAVQTGVQGQFVMVVEDGKVAVRPVRTGIMAGSDFVILDGLKQGGQVIVNGIQKARPGSPVKAVEWNPKENSPAANAPTTSAQK